jgi:hypothetical protein
MDLPKPCKRTRWSTVADVRVTTRKVGFDLATSETRNCARKVLGGCGVAHGDTDEGPVKRKAQAD